MLGCNTKRLMQEVEDAQYLCPHGHSGSCPKSKSLDRCPRSLSWDRPERQVTFWEPEVELDSSERAYRGPWGHSFGMYLEETTGVPPPKGGKQYIPRRCLQLTQMSGVVEGPT